jgi:thiol-disulfide isomerase/thioredoxin
MKKLIFAAMVAIAGWFNAQAQGMPAPEKYNDYLEQVAQLEEKRAEFLMTATMETLAKDPKAYRQMMELAERRFSDAADPIHNETLYMAVLKHASEKFVLSAAEKEKQRLLYEGAKKNMIGSVAIDFDYVTPNDKNVHHLKDLKANNILVYFNNPDCESCEAVKERLASNELINQLVNDKKLIVLAIYPYDDQKLWKKAKYPKMMINGWNQSRNIENNELYDLPTLPCFYLLDNNFKVLMKNEGSLNKVEAMLKNLTTAQEVGPASEKHGLEPSRPAIQPEKPRPATIPAPADDPNTIRSEELLNYVLQDQGQALYESLSDKVKSQAKPEIFNGSLAQIESKMGKYQSHESWVIQEIQGMKAYTSMMSFEKGQLGLVVVYDEDGKVMGINLVPAKALKK